MSTELVTLEETLGFAVDHVQLGVAKHLIYGYSPADISDVLGIPEPEILALIEEPNFQELRTHLGFEHAEQQITTEAGWDGIEAKSLANLHEIVTVNKDGDFNLKVAAVANKANRRTLRGQRAQNGQASTVIQLNLTQRFVDGQIAMQEPQPKVIRGSVTSTLDKPSVPVIDPTDTTGVDQMKHVAVSGVLVDGVDVSDLETKVDTAGNSHDSGGSTLVQPTLAELNAFLDPKAEANAIDSNTNTVVPPFTMDA